MHAAQHRGEAIALERHVVFVGSGDTTATTV